MMRRYCFILRDEYFGFLRHITFRNPLLCDVRHIKSAHQLSAEISLFTANGARFTLADPSCAASASGQRKSPKSSELVLVRGPGIRDRSDSSIDSRHHWRKSNFLCWNSIRYYLFDVNYFSRSTTTISPGQRQLQAFSKLISPLSWCWPEQRIRLCRDAP